MIAMITMITVITMIRMITMTTLITMMTMITMVKLMMVGCQSESSVIGRLLLSVLPPLTCHCLLPFQLFLAQTLSRCPFLLFPTQCTLLPVFSQKYSFASFQLGPVCFHIQFFLPMLFCAFFFPAPKPLVVWCHYLPIVCSCSTFFSPVTDV